MARHDDPFGLLDFVANYQRSTGVTHISEVDEDDLADRLRAFFAVPAFASYAELLGLCARLGVRIDELSASLPALPGANGWQEGGVPTIYLDPDERRRREHTLCHELREVIENTFPRVSARYMGVKTNDNKRMNPRSDHFGGCLLMPKGDTKQALAESGYDVMRFSREKDRPLSSVIVRCQRLYPARAPDGPLAGLWLLEAPWRMVNGRYGTRPQDLVLTARASLNGFSMAKGKAGEADRNRDLFPLPGATAYDYRFACTALDRRGPNFNVTMSSGSITDQDLAMLAEPEFVNYRPWRVLVTAIKEGPERSKADTFIDRLFPVV